jgi:uncharacterized iron-regulated protein
MKPLLCWLIAAATAGVPFSVHAAETAPAASAACLSPAAWNLPDGGRFRAVTPNTVLTASAKREVVLLGEMHADDDHHQWQMQVLAGLYALRPEMVIGFEMFPRRVQPVLDRWVAGELTERQFMEQSEWETVWSMPFELYLPLFQFARINRIPMVALNVDRKLNKAITAKGWAAVPAAEREGVGQAAAPSDAYRDFLFEVYRQHTAMHGQDDSKADKNDKAFTYFVESQTTWDRAMAEGLAQRRQPAAGHDKPLVVGIIGSGHLRYGYGVPHQLRALGVQQVGTLLPMDADVKCTDLRSGLADAVFALPPQASAQPEPPRLGIQLEQNQDSVQIAAITAGSLAEKTGLKSGDRLLELGGMPVKKVPPVIAAIRQQPAGSWLPLRLQRGEATLDVVVKFPPK